MRFIVCFILITASVTYGVAQMKPAGESADHAAAMQQKTSPETQHSSVRNDEVQALRQDVARMKALVQQMQSNLAFVDTSQSPLKHQFQLEIDMWQTLITEMDRRLDEASRPAH
ncbi:MAG TPA: hypothetical protein VFW31_17120 [Candidatus Angelobacter sp.]|nr:hypothetical protein [Candidatus Angelobacter sp.]